MPELPEVETTRRGIAPHLCGQTVAEVTIRAAKLRHPIQPELAGILPGRTIEAIERRGKYLLLGCRGGTLLIHLGMTGHLRVSPPGTPAGRHDHLEIRMESGNLLRLSDPRKFGTVIWLTSDPHSHPLLAGLGPEPFSEEFSPSYLEKVTRGRTVAIKQLIMNSRLLVGVGNIYAGEALFRAGINPWLAAGRLSAGQCLLICRGIKDVLGEAVARGEKTLHSFYGVSERPVYFDLEARVYARGGEPCLACGEKIRRGLLGGRSTFWCPVCQPLQE